jgi:hypothetical protein
VLAELIELAASWRQVLLDDPLHARPLITGLLIGRVTTTPTAKHAWRLTGEGTLAGLFSREVGNANQAGSAFPLGWRARRDLNPRPTGSKPAALSN